MSMWIDHKYAGILSVKLDKFAREGEYLYNFRCPICGDSQKNKTKARGYLFAKKGGMFYKCHNCHASMSLGNLIKAVDPNLYKEYCLDRYKEGETGVKPHKEHNFVFKPVVFESNRQQNAMLRGLTPIKKLSIEHKALQYVMDRKIPTDKYDLLYYVDDAQKLKQFADGYDDKIKGNESRLIIPFIDDSNELIGLSGRALDANPVRYLTVRIKDNVPMIFGLNNVHKNQTIYVTEGPIDSLFLPNAIATGNSNLKAAGEVLNKDDLVLVYDNEPRNKEVMREMKGAIESGFKVCIWPKDIDAKDINEMILKLNMTQKDVLDVINKNTFSGLPALLNYNSWSMV